MKSTLAYLIYTLLFILSLCQQLNAAAFYVSPQGNNSNSGSLYEPLETIHEAVRLAQLSNGADTIYLRGNEGIHFLGGALVLDQQCDNIVFKAFGNEKPIVTSGVEIKDWSEENGMFFKDLGTSFGTNGNYFKTLYASDEILVRARTPNIGASGYGPFHTADAADNIDEKNWIRYKSGQLKVPYSNLYDVDIFLLHPFICFNRDIVSLNQTTRDIHYNTTLWPNAEPWHFYIEGAFEELDAPGEWYLHPTTGRLWYFPKPGETAATFKAFAPKDSYVIRVEGKVNDPVENVKFEGISFRYADWKQQTWLETHLNVNEAVIFTQYARNISIVNCEVAYAGSHGILFGNGSMDCVAFKNHLHNLGMGGIYTKNTLKNPANNDWRCWVKPESDKITRIRIENNIINRISLVIPGGAGLANMGGNYITCKYNDISGYAGFGIQGGWCGEGNLNDDNNLIWSNNYIHHLGEGIMGDFGGFHAFGQLENSKIENNIFAYFDGADFITVGGKKAHNKMAHGIYIDGCHSFDVKKNLIYAVEGYGVFRRGGPSVNITNNIFAFSRNTLNFMENINPTPPMTIARNIWLSGHNAITDFTSWNPDKIVNDPSKTLIHNNVYWKYQGLNTYLDFDGNSFSRWQSFGWDVNSIVQNPLFVVASPGKPEEFKLQSNSPAFQHGFSEWDISDVGVYGDFRWYKKARDLKFSADYTKLLDFTVSSQYADIQCVITNEHDNINFRLCDKSGKVGLTDNSTFADSLRWVLIHIVDDYYYIQNVKTQQRLKFNINNAGEKLLLVDNSTTDDSVIWQLIDEVEFYLIKSKLVNNDLSFLKADYQNSALNVGAFDNNESNAKFQIFVVKKGVGDFWLSNSKVALKKELFSIAPNPARDIVKINCEGEFKIECFNMQGLSVFVKTNQLNNCELDFSSLPKGLYLIRLTNQQLQQEIKKLIIN